MEEQTLLFKTCIITIIVVPLIISLLKRLLKKTSGELIQPGCLIGILFIAFFTFCVVKCSVYEPLYESTSNIRIVNADQSITTVRVPNEELAAIDSSYIHNKYIYLNKTGRILVKYSVKYTTTGDGDNHTFGQAIYPEEYFYWFGETNDSHRMFGYPPSHTTVYRRSPSNNDFTFLTFLNYIDNIPDYVEVHGLRNHLE